MKVLVIGSGGREHALAWKLAQSERLSQLATAPGNPGTAGLGVNLKPANQTPAAYLQIARDFQADLTVVGPEAPLVAGVVDAFRAEGLAVIGPTQAAAQLEGSKAFSKAFMVRAGIPTAGSYTAESADDARGHIGDFGYPVVLKADGLAAGKGVIIAPDEKAALEALETLPAGRIVIEEFLTGEEVSYIILADGERFRPLEATQDHKAVWDGDQGPNTGGMGAYCDGRILTPDEGRMIDDLVVRPALRTMTAEGTPYTGFLYVGLMMTAAGPKVLEFNARLGDPETQALLHRLDSDLLSNLADFEDFRWRPDPSVCIVMAAHGYPASPRTGDTITGIDNCSAVVFQAGTRLGSAGLETSGGRVLGVTAAGKTLESAITNAYAGVRSVHFDGMHYRTDIGRKGLKRW